MEFVAEYGMFLAKTVTAVVAILVVIGAVAAISARHKTAAKEHVEVKHLNQKFEGMARLLESATMPKKEMKQREKTRKKQAKAEKKKLSSEADSHKKRIYVLNFDGDIRGSDVASLREEVTAVLTVATPEDEVLLRLESTGGLVHAYGLAASQLQRVKDKKIPLTAAVDKVAASGGYMMACVADKIIAAPFSIIGSIGVLTQIPNFHRLLKKHDIDFEQITAGEFKRTVTLFGETTDKAREKLKEEVEETHVLFKDFIKQQRPALEVEKVATGEHWLGSRALELGLVDELRTSDDYLLVSSEQADIYEITYTTKQTIIEKLASLMCMALRSRQHHLPATNDRTPMV
jgi:serine protease SohB